MGFLEENLSVTLTTDSEIAELAGRFGRACYPTDVLAFSMLEGEDAEFRGQCLGDVVISVETAARQAAGRGVPLDAELSVLLVHGVLHVLGLDHERAGEAQAMQMLEDHLSWELSRLGQ